MRTRIERVLDWFLEHSITIGVVILFGPVIWLSFTGEGCVFLTDDYYLDKMDAPPEMRLVVEMAANGDTHEDIAEVMELSVAEIKRTLLQFKRGVRDIRLQKLWQGKEGTAE